MQDQRPDLLAHLTELARLHLSSEEAEEWLRLLRPAVCLTEASDGEPVLATQGGLPPIAVDDWPVFGDHMLPHLLTLDCAQLGPAAMSVARG